MNGVVSDLRSKFENNHMYVINQKPSHFPNNLPNGPIYFPESQMYPGMHMHGEQVPFPSCAPSPMTANHSPMQSSMTRFINPQNGNSLRQPLARTSAIMPLGNKNMKSIENNLALIDDVNLPFQVADNFYNTNNIYKSRIPSLDSNGQSITNLHNNSKLVTDFNKSGNIPTESCMPPVHTNGTNRVQTPRNKRPRAAANCGSSRSHTPIAKDSICNQTARPATSTNVNVIPSAANVIAHQKCLPNAMPNGNNPLPYNIGEMIPQQLVRPRISNNSGIPYGCNRPQIIDKNASMFPPGPLASPIFNPSSQPGQPFFTQMDSSFLLPMFHLHSKLSKLPECDRLTFPVNHGNLWGPLTLRHGDQVTEVQFDLNQDNLQQIANRSDLDIVVTSFTHRDQFRLCHWPEFLELSINGNLLSLDCTLIQDLKAHSPCCIKKYCKLGTNTLQFTVSKCVCCHLFQIYMVHRPTLSYAMETIQNKCTTSLSTKSLLTEIYGRSYVPSTTNVEDSTNLCIISLICPMSQTKITIPARTKSCKHIQPFDLLEFLRVQTKWPQYFCPICRVRITFNLNEYIQNIIVDEIIKDILLQTDHNVRRVIIYPDGKWKSVNDMKPEMAAVIPQNFHDSCDSEPSNTSIRQSPIALRSVLSPSPLLAPIKSNLCNPMNVDKRTNEFYTQKMNHTVNSSSKPSRNQYSDSSLSRTNTPMMPIALEPSPQKRSRTSPTLQRQGDTGCNVSMPVTEIVNSNSPESMKTPQSSISVSPLISVAQSQSATNPPSSISSTNRKQAHHHPDSPPRHNNVQINPQSNVTVNFTNSISIRTSAAVNVDSANKQTSSGSSNPSSPPDFFDSHSSTTNYEDEDNSSLHLQRLIGFIDEILSEEEEYVLDTQWASFTWPSADKALDLLHLSDIEKLL